VLDPLQRAIAERAGMVVVSDLGTLDIPWDHDVVLLQRRYARSNPAIVDALLRGLVEANAFIMNPANKAAVLPILGKELQLDRREDVELAYTLTRSLYVVARPYPSMEAARVLIDAVRAEFPQLGQAPLEAHIDTSFRRALDGSGFIDRIAR
jgi:ABC-type nitrate/sulfonate/bicarbonate transport system substrate-binding protein